MIDLFLLETVEEGAGDKLHIICIIGIRDKLHQLEQIHYLLSYNLIYALPDNKFRGRIPRVV